MARKATDLLDVFRFGDGGDDDPKRGREERRASKERKAERKAAAKPRRRTQGLLLNPRQVVLGSSAIVLLLVLSFVLGLSTGRRKSPAEGDSGAGPAIQRTVSGLIAIRGDMPLVDRATRKAIDPAAIAAILKRDYRLKRENLKLIRAEGRLVIEIGPFDTEEQARDYLRKSGLALLHVHMEDPFRWPEFVAWR